MTLPADSLIAHALEKMHTRLAAKPRHEDGKVRSGLLFTGNIHDAMPRRLLLDTRLSPLDKMGWMMIRLYAQTNEGAIFPTYDELQLQLASPGRGKAPRETVSRVLLMLRITGWISLCQRVRDNHGRVRGNIYAQHDEPLTFRDAELLDPRYLDTVAEACLSKNKTISETALLVLNEIKLDPTMRHYRSHISMLETRMGYAQNGSQMAGRQEVMIGSAQLSSDSEPGKNRGTTKANKLSSESEPSKKQNQKTLSSESELPVKSSGSDRVRKPNHYVRSFTQSVNKNTYVLPTALMKIVSQDEQSMLTSQLSALPDELSSQILTAFAEMMSKKQLSNPVGWMFTMLKKAREGALKPLPQGTQKIQTPVSIPSGRPEQKRFVPKPRDIQPASQETVLRLVSELRTKLNKPKHS
ncbi:MULTISPECIES: STY4528 family pathogenicity island replication protein [unclassified Tatumella]|uniref:STY4528 family pathogenicity island replication protein n=1 Tax=unclassified Tatumella TaxID=2649542 RepID=UPI001BAEFDC3|nr:MULTISPECIES: STY4528 family pathogenicity island replication protein [unclassified Tatumella]MBS0878942.1 helix-turn-helix domain-containing protein [Tatumella sp. JGM82]MBS0892388.1 helix-turn-helix domain-containing protein [Tatumella sp. JGM94]MBS0903477.1 helix-turn-helix domain-containing protein [Tatumella sp. JGM100]